MSNLNIVTRKRKNGQRQIIKKDSWILVIGHLGMCGYGYSVRLGSHRCELDAGFPTFNLHDRWLWPALNGPGSHISGAAAERIAQESCASLAPFQVQIQAKIQAWFVLEMENRDSPDPCCELHSEDSVNPVLNIDFFSRWSCTFQLDCINSFNLLDIIYWI